MRAIVKWRVDSTNSSILILSLGLFSQLGVELCL
jgi:hypothetical protein